MLGDGSFLQGEGLRHRRSGGRSLGNRGAGHLLSAVELHFSGEEFEGALIPYPGDEEYHDLRDARGVFVYRQRSTDPDEEVLVLPLSTDAVIPTGVELSALPIARFRRALGVLIERRLPDVLPESLALERRRFAIERLKRDEDLVELALDRASVPRPPGLSGVSKHMRTRFQLRTEYVRGRGSLLLLTIQFGVAFVLDQSMSDLITSGVRVEGLRATRSNDVGYVAAITQADVHVETELGSTTWPISETSPTASSEAMRRVFTHALTGGQFDSYQQAEAQVLAERISGSSYSSRLRTVARWLSQRGEIDVAEGISFRFGNLLSLPSRSRPSAVSNFPPTQYCFSRDRTALNTIPAQGLSNHGPADGDTFDKKEPSVLVVYPDGQRVTAESFVRSLRDGLPSSRAFARGFVATYRLSRLDARFVPAQVHESPSDPARTYLAALEQEFDPSTRTDAAIFLIRDEDAEIPDEINPYVAAKAWLLAQGIPSQGIRLSKATKRAADLQYILQDLSVALYAKLGGSPWTVLPSTPLAREVVVGMAYSETSERFRQRRRYMGIATVFSSDGTYILGAASPQCTYEEYPTVLAETVRGTIRRLATEQRWMRGDLVRLVVHMGKPLTRHDIETLSRAATSELVEGVRFETAFIKVLRDHPFTLVAPSQSGRRQWVDTLDGKFGKVMVGEAVPERGTVVDLGRRRRLLCVTGPQQLKREGGAHPTPLLVELHRDSTYAELAALTRQVFQFTGLSWRSVRPISEPVTLSYPRLIARLVSRLSLHPSWSPDLINTHLLRSRWFL